MDARALIAIGTLMVMAAACGQKPDLETYRRDVEKFRAKHEADYRKEYVSLAGLWYLDQGANSAGSADNDVVHLPPSVPAEIGTFTLQDKTVRFEPKAGAPVMLKGQPVTAAIDLKSDGGKDPADELTVGSVAFWVHNSGDRRAVRVRDEQGEVARTFAGYTWFPIDQHYRIVGRFIKDPEPRKIQVPMITGDFATYTTEGLVEFTLDGQTIRMRPMTTRPNRFFFIFTDGTTGHETYHAARFLYTDLLPDGTTVLDFNEAYNPPCSFNPFTTCPLPPPENKLTVKIVAGEKNYAGHRVEPATTP